jgi:hypothetical protein
MTDTRIEYGSLTNRMLSTQGIEFGDTISVGDGATILWWTDRLAGTVTRIIQAEGVITLTVQEDHAHRLDPNGMSDCQQYRYERNPVGRRFYVTWRDGAWRTIDGKGVVLGRRDAFYDYSF